MAESKYKVIVDAEKCIGYPAVKYHKTVHRNPANVIEA